MSKAPLKETKTRSIVANLIALGSCAKTVESGKSALSKLTGKATEGSLLKKHQL